MISFDCPGCGKKLSVKDELAGKKGKCPGCGQSLVVPPFHSAPVQPKKTTPLPSKSAPLRSHEQIVLPVKQVRPVRWPLYAGGGAVALCVLVAMFFIFVIPGNDRTPTKKETAAVTPPEAKPKSEPKPEGKPKPEPKPETKLDPKPEPKPEAKPEPKGEPVLTQAWQRSAAKYHEEVDRFRKNAIGENQFPESKSDFAFKGGVVPNTWEVMRLYAGQVEWEGVFEGFEGAGELKLDGRDHKVNVKLPKGIVLDLHVYPRTDAVKQWQTLAPNSQVRFRATIEGVAGIPVGNVVIIVVSLKDAVPMQGK